MPSHIGHRHIKNLCRDAVRMAHMRLYNVWAVLVVGVQMVKVNQYQIQQQQLVNQIARKSAKWASDDHHHVAKVVLADQGYEMEYVDAMIIKHSIAIWWMYFMVNIVVPIQPNKWLPIKWCWIGNSIKWTPIKMIKFINWNSEKWDV